MNLLKWEKPNTQTCRMHMTEIGSYAEKQSIFLSIRNMRRFYCRIWNHEQSWELLGRLAMHIESKVFWKKIFKTKLLKILKSF